MPPRRRPNRRALSRRAGPLRWAARVFAALGMLAVVAALVLAGMLRGTLPPEEETLTLAALENPVSISLDAHGIPRIAAGSEHDAAVALGVLHARDRMFQMEVMRRGAQGRLAEVAGPAALRADRFVRTLGLARRAEEDLAALPAGTRALLEAYAAGVNAWIAARGRLAAPEFLALGAPEPWRPEHSLLWAKVMGLWLSVGWRDELARERLAAAGLAEARIAELWPADETAGRPDLAIPEVRGAAVVDPALWARLAAALPGFPQDPGALPGSASNAWVVASARSESGAPLLATDPHLGFQAPVLWYLVRIDLPGGRMRAGATSPGVPLIVLGRNESVAWSFTTTHSDTQDLFVERLAGTDAYETPEGPRPFAVREEAIRVRGRDAPEILRVRETRHGPVLSDLAELARAAPGTVVAAAMANLAPNDTAAPGLLAVNRARDLDEVRAAAALISSPPQNLLAADRAGRIALYLTGRTPVRRAGDGSRPARGWDGSQDWTGFVPFEDMPHVEDPPSGALVNANNRVAPEGGPFLGREWPGDWRFRRIGELLGAAPQHDAAGFAAMQMDTVSLLARALVMPADAVLRRVPRPEGTAAARALDLLLAWDGNAAPDRPEPLIFAAWREAVLALAFAGAGVAEAARPAGTAEFLAFLLHPDGRGAWWCGGDCAALAGRALVQAVDGLAATQGADPAAWRWDALHVARFEHPLLRFVPILGPLIRLEAPTGGDGETVNRGGYRDGGPGGGRFQHVHGAGLRLVADLADPDATLVIIATGQSGHPLSLHWGDLLEPWRGGGTLRLGREPDSVEGRILLLP
ncbi:MAG: penicillin acylase family protein [Acetobacteraceae bacterium]|nr:penicillin acylase family protein [Acetobacteraceae bacterium]